MCPCCIDATALLNSASTCCAGLTCFIGDVPAKAGAAVRALGVCIGCGLAAGGTVLAGCFSLPSGAAFTLGKAVSLQPGAAFALGKAALCRMGEGDGIALSSEL